MTEEQKAIERLTKAQNDIWYATLYSQEEQDKDIQTVLNLIQKQQEEIEILKRDFEIVDHECSRLEQEDIKKDKEIEQYQNMLATNDMLHVLECEKKDKIIEQFEKECRQFKAFCRRVRRDEKHDVDLFNQGQEHKCNQFLNLISGEPHWSYAGKYFDDTDNQIKEYFEKKVEEKQ